MARKLNITRLIATTLGILFFLYLLWKLVPLAAVLSK